MPSKSDSVQVFLLGFLAVLAAWAAAGAALMLLLGALWNEFGILRPIGFIPATGIMMGVLLLLGMIRRR